MALSPKKKAPPPTPVTVEELRDVLLDLRSRLRGDHRTLQRETSDTAHAVRAPLHPADAATDNQDAEFNALLLAGNADMLDDVEDAIVRLNEGKFGVCQKCGEPIGSGRLRAKPWARLCISCKSREESGEDDSD